MASVTHIALDLESLSHLQLCLIGKVLHQRGQLDTLLSRLLNQEPGDNHETRLCRVGVFTSMGAGDLGLVRHRLTDRKEVVD